MKSSWAARLPGAAIFSLLIAALISLQISIAGARLVYELPAFALIALAAAVACVSSREKAGASRFAFETAVLFCGYLLVRAMASPSPYHARSDLCAVLAALTVYGLAAIALPRARTRMALITALLSFGLCHVLVCLIQFGLGHNFVFFSALQGVEATSRPSGLYGGPDHLAGLLEILGIFGLSVTCWSRWPKWGKVLLGYLTLTCYIGLALTGSRGGYLSAGASLLLFALLSLLTLGAGGSFLFWRWGVVGLVVLIAAIVAGGWLMQQNTTLSDRLEKIVAADEGRLDIWQSAIKQWHLQPWTGTGSGTFRFYGRQFRTERMQQDPVAVHNDYLHLLCEYGLIGGAAFLLMLGAHLWSGARQFIALGPGRLAGGSFPLSDRLALNLGALGAITAYIVHSAVDFNLHLPANALLIAFAFGILANRGPHPAAEEVSQRLSLLPRIGLGLVASILLVQCVRLLPGEYFADRTRVALEAEDPATAIAFAQQALTYEKENPKIYFYLGRAFTALASEKVSAEEQNAGYEAAVLAFDHARILSPLDGNLPLDIGLLYDRMERFDEAEWMFGLARERDPRSAELGALYRTHLRLWERGGS